MSLEWNQLTNLTGNKNYIVTGVRLKESEIQINGEFELPPLAKLSYEDQVFVGEFIRSHGSIKHMEKAFGVSYPTIKNRLKKISSQLQLVEVEITASKEDILSALEAGDISAKEAIERLRG